MTLHELQQAGKADVNAKRLSLHALVLAAGRGSRFGGSKLRANYQGKPLLAYPLELIGAAREAGLIEEGHVVIPTADVSSCRLIRELKLEPVLNNAPALGISYSLQLGVDALEKSGTAEAALILLGDQPLVRLEVINALISARCAGERKIIRPRYAATPDIPGHPVLLPRSMWPLIRALKGDAGLASLGSGVDETLVDVAGHNPDVDTLIDLQALESFLR